MKRLVAGGLLAVAVLATPAPAVAHPIGNFTINHYAGLEVAPNEIRLDVVIDRAEIPTFQERLRLDLDQDGEVSDEEAAAAREPECRALAPDLSLTVDGRPAGVDLIAAGLSFPGGAGGLSTMRLVCEFVAPIEGGLGGGRGIAFADGSFAERLGWREVVVAGNGATIDGPPDLLRTSPSARLTEYPPERLTAPLNVEAVAFRAGSGGPTLPPFAAPDAQPVAGAPARPRGPEASPGPAAVAGAAIPGGVAGEIPAIFQATDLSPAVLLVAIVTAVALGAGHALTPGHGKTLMAAYLVGRRGTALHAAGLGLSVSVAHTAGILLLAGSIVAAGSALPADLVVRWLPVVAAATIAALGGWMLVTEVRRRRAGRQPLRDGPRVLHGHGPVHDHEPAHGAAGHHAHRHVPGDGSPISWRSLFALGLAGGLVPSTSALVILLGTLAAGRPAFGLLLVVAFGLGMALVMGGLGLGLVLARDRLEHATAGPALERVRAWAPLAAAGVVFGLGLWLTARSILVAPGL